jgi:hypothetical protein
MRTANSNERERDIMGRFKRRQKDPTPPTLGRQILARELHPPNPDTFQVTWTGRGELTQPWARGSWRRVEWGALKSTFRDGRLPARSDVPSTSRPRPANPLRTTGISPRGPRAAGSRRRQELEHVEHAIYSLCAIWDRIPPISVEAAHAFFKQLEVDPSFHERLQALDEAVVEEAANWAYAPARWAVTVATALYGLRAAFDRACADIAAWPFHLRWIAFCAGVRSGAARSGLDVAAALADSLRVATYGPLVLAGLDPLLEQNPANFKAFVVLRDQLVPAADAADAADAARHLASIAIRSDPGRWRSLERRGQTRKDLQSAILGELLRRYPTLTPLGLALAAVDERLAITPRAGLEALNRTVRAEAAPPSVRAVAFEFQTDDRFDADTPRDRHNAGATHYDYEGFAAHQHHERVTLRVNMDTGSVDHLRVDVDPELLADAVRALRRRTGAQARRFAAAEACLLTEATPEQIAQEHGCSVRSLPAWQAEFVEALKAQIYKLKKREKDSK